MNWASKRMFSFIFRLYLCSKRTKWVRKRIFVSLWMLNRSFRNFRFICWTLWLWDAALASTQLVYCVPYIFSFWFSELNFTYPRTINCLIKCLTLNIYYKKNNITSGSIINRKTMSTFLTVIKYSTTLISTSSLHGVVFQFMMTTFTTLLVNGHFCFPSFLFYYFFCCVLLHPVFLFFDDQVGFDGLTYKIRKR